MSSVITMPVHRLGDLCLEQSGGIVKPVSYSFAFAGAAANQQLVAASSVGRKVRLLSLIVSASGAAATTLTLQDGSAGSPIMILTIPANTSATPNVILDLNELGWVDTSVNAGLFCTIGAAGGAFVSIRAASYLP